jgi:3-isopropylmalate/(R)-2-methylmalate dehydratase large subunit
MGQTLTEKILSKAAGKPVHAGDLIFPEPELVVVHDWYAVNVAKTLAKFGVERLHAPDRVMFVTDHEPLAVTPESAARQKQIRDIAGQLGIGHFFDVGRGGHGHVFPVELGYVRPGMYVAAYDTHVPNYGAVGALGIPFLTEIAEVMALGSAWICVPETIRIHIAGKLPKWVSVRDLAQRLIGDLDPDLVDYTVVEFYGPALADLPFDARFTLCNTPLEIGAKSALVEPDAVTVDFLKSKRIGTDGILRSDPDARFRTTIGYELDSLEPQIALPPLPDNVVSISQAVGTPIQHAFIGSCASGLLSDLRAAAEIMRHRKVDPGVRMFVTPATQEIMTAAAAEGLIEIFAQAGAIVTAPGCGPCAGGRIGPVAPGENSINTGTRNDYGRLGPSDAQIFLAGPISVACAAIAGCIVDPREMLG